MTYYDYLFTVLFTLIFPIVGYINYQKIIKEAASGKQPCRFNLYKTTMLTQWTICITGLALWTYLQRDWTLMGFDLIIDNNFYIAAAICLVVITLLVVQLLSVKKMSEDDLSKVKTSLGEVSLLIPHSKKELTHFYGVAFTAGVVEEILWRGMLIWFLTHYMNIWAAASISVLLFALAHAYQGVKHIPGVFIAGVLFTALYLISGSIWLSIITHIAVDVLQGTFAQNVLSHIKSDCQNSEQLQDVTG